MIKRPAKWRSDMSSENPIPTVGVIALRDNNVLLVRSGKDSHHVSGTYGLPAGRVEQGEDEVAAAQREFLEETGLVSQELIEFDNNTFEADVPRSDGSIVRMFWRVYLATKVTGELSQSSEAIPSWRPLSDLETLPLQPNVKKAINNAQIFINK